MGSTPDKYCHLVRRTNVGTGQCQEHSRDQEPHLEKGGLARFKTSQSKLKTSPHKAIEVKKTESSVPYGRDPVTGCTEPKEFSSSPL